MRLARARCPAARMQQRSQARAAQPPLLLDTAAARTLPATRAPGGADAQRAAHVDGPANHAVAGGLVHGAWGGRAGGWKWQAGQAA